MTDESFRTTAATRREYFGSRAIRSENNGPFAPTCFTSPAITAITKAYAQLARRLSELESSKNLGGNGSSIFPLTEVYRDIVEQLGRAASFVRLPGFLGAHHHRKTLWQDWRPQRLNRFVLNVFRGEADLPH